MVMIMAANKGKLLFTAVANGDIEAIKILLADGVCPNITDHAGRTPLHHAAGCGMTGVVFCLMKRGAKPGLRDDNGFTALNHAMQNGHIETADVICEEIAIRQALRAELRSISRHHRK